MRRALTGAAALLLLLVTSTVGAAQADDRAATDLAGAVERTAAAADGTFTVAVTRDGVTQYAGRAERDETTITWWSRDKTGYAWLSDPTRTLFTLKGYAFDQGLPWTRRTQNLLASVLADQGYGSAYVERERDASSDAADRAYPVRVAADALDNGTVERVESRTGQVFRVSNWESVHLIVVRNGLIRSVTRENAWGSTRYRLTAIGSNVQAPEWPDIEPAPAPVLDNAVFFLRQERTLTSTASSVSISVRAVAEEQGQAVDAGLIQQVVQYRGLVGNASPGQVWAELTRYGARLLMDQSEDTAMYGTLCRVVEKKPGKPLRVRTCRTPT